MNKLLVSSRKGLIIYTRIGGGWEFESLHFRGIPVCLAHYDASREVLWAFLDHGHWGVKFQRSKDFGQNWEEVPALAYPEGMEVKDGVPATLHYVWAAETDHRGRMWIGTVPGGLFSSEDGGETFQLNMPLWNDPGRSKWFGGGMDHPGVHSVVIDPADPDHIFIGISVGGVYETVDGGKSWQVRNKGLRADFLPDPHAEVGHDPHLLVQCIGEPDHMWQQNHCGIFRTTDGAQNWNDVSQEDGPASFGFAVAVDKNDPNVAWVAPGVSDEIRVAVDQQLCISRTEDGGASWEALRSGLPQEQSFDIVYRHALVSYGDELFFGTTTGNLFYSNNRGDDWQTISNFLPLINAVVGVDK